jgi:hypothetical protein
VEIQHISSEDSPPLVTSTITAPGIHLSSNGIDLSAASGSTRTERYAIRAWLLSHDVPALSNPSGKNSVFSTQTAPNQDTDIDSLKAGNWGDWKHSDMKNAPMDVVGKLYEKMVERGILK